MRENKNLVFFSSIVFGLVIFLVTVIGATALEVEVVKCPELDYSVVDGQIKCVSCPSGFELVNDFCKMKQPKDLNIRNPLDDFINNNGASLVPENPALGKLIVFVAIFAAIIFAIILFVRLIKNFLARAK